MTNTSKSESDPQPSVPPLLEACMENNVDRVKEMVGTFLASYSSPDVGYVKPGSDPELVRYVNAVDAQGNAALHGAVFQGNLTLVKFLVENGACVSSKNDMGCFALWLAAGYDKRDVLEYLLAKERGSASLLMETNNTGDTPLLAAASRGNAEVCQMLVQAAREHSPEAESLVGPMLLRRNQNGDSPLAVAVAGGHFCGFDKDNGSKKKLFQLLFEPQHSNELLNVPNRQGLTPLLVACERDWLDVCRLLLEKHGASIEVRDGQGATPLAVAAFCGSRDVSAFLLEKYRKKLLNVTNKSGCTPLWLASRTGNAAMVQILLDAGADAEISNTDGLTPLEVATKFDKQAVVDIFQKQ